MDNTYYCAPANFTNNSFIEETINTTDVMNQIDSGIMINESTKLMNVDNTYNDLLILKHDLLKYLKNEKIYFDEELEINIEKVEPKTNVLVDALSEFFKEFKDFRKKHSRTRFSKHRPLEFVGFLFTFDILHK